MESKGNNVTSEGHTQADEAAPLFDDESVEEARPVSPLGQDGTIETPVKTLRQARSGQPLSLMLVLAVVVGGAVGAGAGFLTYVREAPEPSVEATTGLAPEPSAEVAAEAASGPTSYQRPASDRSDLLPTAGSEGPQAAAESPARDETELFNTRETDGRERDEEDRVEREREEEKRRRKVAEKLAETKREEAEEREERRREEAKRGKAKARLVGVITDRNRH